MSRKIKVVYEHGMLRPLEPLELGEGEEITVTFEESSEGESIIDTDFQPKVGEKEMSLAEIRERLSKIPGNMSKDVIAEREERG